MNSSAKRRAVVLVDGVHKSDNSINGIRELAARHNFEPVRLVWIGGTEKMKDPESFSADFREAFGAEVLFEGDLDSGRADAVEGLHKALEGRDIELVVQLSGSPQVNRRLMNRYAQVAVGYGAKYIAGGTVFAEDTSSARVSKPSAGLYATDKRVGKTAFGVYVAALMSGLRGAVTPWSSISITHSRGGPPSPPVLAICNNQPDNKPAAEMELAEIYNHRFRPEVLERLLDFGLHGASDVYEDALILSEYLTAWEKGHPGQATPQMHVIGCRRAGAGYFHEFAVSNVELGLAAAETSDGDFILHEGSGGEHPPVAVDGTITLVPADTDEELLEDFPGMDTTDLIILAHCQSETASSEKIDSVERVLASRARNAKILRTLFEPEVIGARDQVHAALRGKRVALFTTAPKTVEERLSGALERDYMVNVVRTSFTLARHHAMVAEIDELMKSAAPPEVFLMEIKARGVEGAGYIRRTYAVPVMYVNNVPRQVDKTGQTMPDNSSLDGEILKALNRAVQRFNAREKKAVPLCEL
jgi:predicted GTPase